MLEISATLRGGNGEPGPGAGVHGRPARRFSMDHCIANDLEWGTRFSTKSF